HRHVTVGPDNTLLAERGELGVLDVAAGLSGGGHYHSSSSGYETGYGSQRANNTRIRGRIDKVGAFVQTGIKDDGSRYPAADTVCPASRAASMNRCIFSGSFSPGRHSTPLATSTIAGRTRRIASATFSGVNPPARINGTPGWKSASICHGG